eukprot:2016980-Rhodomonas_salina.1
MMRSRGVCGGFENIFSSHWIWVGGLGAGARGLGSRHARARRVPLLIPTTACRVPLLIQTTVCRVPLLIPTT